MNREKNAKKAMTHLTISGRQQRGNQSLRQDELEIKRKQEEATMATQQALLSQLRDQQQLQMEQQQQQQQQFMQMMQMMLNSQQAQSQGNYWTFKKGTIVSEQLVLL